MLPLTQRIISTVVPKKLCYTKDTQKLVDLEYQGEALDRERINIIYRINDNVGKSKYTEIVSWRHDR